jgi:hypothetical protein
MKNREEVSRFDIDFIELSFLAEACIPPRPIARTMFWQSLTDKYWFKMTDNERNLLFEWLNRDEYYKKSLEEQNDTKIFHARYDPDNQYMVKTNFKNEIKEHRAFKMQDMYYINSNTSIQEQYITLVEKINIKD